MRMRALVGLAAGLALWCGAAFAAETETLDVLVQKTRTARLAGDNANWLAFGRRVVALAPEHVDLLYSVARAESVNGNTDAAFALLSEAVRRGGGFDLSVKEFDALRALPRFTAVAAANERNRMPVTRATLFAEIAEPSVVPEGIAYDAAGRRFFVGSLRGSIWQIGMDSKVAPFVKPAGRELREVLGLKVDAVRGLLWCAHGVFPDQPPPPTPKPDTGVGGVNAYDLATGALRVTAMLDERPMLHGFNDLAVARGGDVYVTDTERSALYRIKAGTQTLEAFWTGRGMTFVNGLQLSPDERVLYVAHVEGISAVDLATREATRLRIGSEMTVGSIDGLAWHNGALIGVQNSPNLARVVRLKLSKDARSVVKLEVLASRGLLDLGATTGTVAEGAFYAVASTLDEAPDAPKPRVLRIPL
jgi:sugar lactone lactonase YvrE